MSKYDIDITCRFSKITVKEEGKWRTRLQMIV